MLELPDTAGLICGFRFSSDGTAIPLDWSGHEQASSITGPAWLHFRLSDHRSQHWLSSCEFISEPGRRLLLDTDNRIHIEASARGFAGVLGDLRFEPGTDPDRLGVVRFYVDDHVIITARLHALQAFDQLRLDVRNGLRIASPVEILFHFLESVTDNLTLQASAQSDIVDDIEDLVLKDRFLRESEELGVVRRLLTRLRRQVDAQRHALAQLLHRPPRWFQDKDMAELRRAIERLNAVFLDLEAIQERARLLQDEIAGRIANATNRNLYVVSLLTAVFLPITLISGIFGMNVGGLPWVNQADGFTAVLVVMVTTIAISLGFLHWRRFF